jgi:serine/threonine protein kinase/tetratricopeptide (TPR) repeat protein
VADRESKDRAIFLAALEQKTPADRAALLDEACGDDADLRRRVEALLQAHDQPGDFLSSPATAPAGTVTATIPPASSSSAGSIVAGRYKLLEEIGVGGMGSVWMAEQREPVKRRVAVKLIRAERESSRTILARFEAERQAIALMDHPHVAKLLDAGTTESEPGGVSPGKPFFVMELVKGVPLTEFCDEHKLSIADRLKLFTQVCSAVQHAHQKGIIHRDLKPTNILVEMHDDRPVPKIIDFGLAKALSGQPLSEHTLFTGFGTVAGTPLYMAPEQAKFNAIDIDTRADIYALGVILYELLTGSTPIERATLKQAALDEVLRVIRESEPPAPSKRLSSTQSQPSVAANRHTEPAKLGRLVRGDLDWIVMKALAKERDRRYETASGFARDVERFLNHEPVLAGPPTLMYKLRKFMRRNKVQVLAASLVLVALLAGIAGTSFGLVRAEHRRQDADKARREESKQRAEAERARDRTRQALDAMTSSVTGDSLTTQKALSADQKKFLTEVLTYYQEFAGEKADDEGSRARTAAAAHRVGLIEYRLGRQEQSALALQMAQDGYVRLTTEFPAVAEYKALLAGTQNNLGNLLADMGKRSEAEKQYRNALAIQKRLATDFPSVPKYRQNLAACHNNLGYLLKVLGKQPEAEEQFRKALARQEKLAADFPTEPAYRADLAISHYNLGTLLEVLGTLREAEDQHRDALAIQEKLAAGFPTVPGYREDLANTHNRLGIVLSRRGNRSGAEQQYRKAVAIQEKLAADFPAAPVHRRALAATHNDLGVLLSDLGKRSAAEEEYRRSLAIQETLAADFPAAPLYRHELADSHNSLASLLAQVGKRSEAEDEYRKAVGLQEKLVAEFSTVPAHRQALSRSHNNLGVLLAGLGRRAGAEEHYRRGLAVKEKLAADFPTVPEYRHELAVSRNNLGNLLADAEKFSEAEGEYRKALAIQERLAAEFPGVPGYRESLALSHHNLGNLLDDPGKRSAAEEQYRKGLAIQEKLAADFPAVPGYRHELAVSHYSLGNLLAGVEKPSEAEAAYRKALAIQERITADFPAVPVYRKDLARTHNSLGNLLAGRGKRSEAEEQLRKALAIQEKLAAEFPTVPEYQAELGAGYLYFGTLFSTGGRPSESLEWFDRAIRTLTAVYEQDRRFGLVRQDLRYTHMRRAEAYDRLQKYDEAVKDWSRAIELSSNEEQPTPRIKRATSWVNGGQIARAIAEVAELTRSSNWNAEQWYDLACIYAIASGKIADKKQAYADRAMEMLTKALTAGYKDMAHLKQDEDLDSLRNRDDFKKLLAESTSSTEAGKQP